MPLVIAPLNKEMIVIKIMADDKTLKDLEDLGVIINSTITVLSSSNGSLVCNVSGTRLVLDHSLASKIVVA